MAAPTITYNFFRGSVPRIAAHLLREGDAQRALDVRLETGRLEAWREPSLELATKPETKTVYLYDCCWLEFPACVSVTEGSVTCREIYVTGLAGFPIEGRVEDDCSVSWRRLGMPCPLFPPRVTDPNDLSNKDVEGRSYCYAYVNRAGAVGQMSPGSSPILINDGTCVTVSGWEIPPAEWDITEVQIYRSVSANLSGQAPGAVDLANNKQDTFWMVVGKTSITSPTFIDCRVNEELTSSSQYTYMPPPPANLEGIGSISSMNVLFGFVGNKLYFTENNNPHAWIHSYTLDDNIRAVTYSDGMIYVATDGHPYMLSATDECDHAGCRRVVRFDEALPMVGFGVRRMAAVPGGAVYPSHKGLVLLGDKGRAKLITYNLYSPEQWQRLQPDSITPIFHVGKLFVFGKGGSFVITLKGGAEDLWAFDGHSELSDRVLDAFESRQGFLYLHKTDGVYRWEGSSTRRSYLWLSPKALMPRHEAYGIVYVRVDSGGIGHIRILRDGHLVSDRDVFKTQYYTLPNWAVGMSWEIEVTGTASVSVVSIATQREGLMT